MAKVVQERMMTCKLCDKETLHRRNSKQLSWAMHLVLFIFTLGIWFVIWLITLIWHGLTKPMGRNWICSECGGKRSTHKSFRLTR